MEGVHVEAGAEGRAPRTKGTDPGIRFLHLRPAFGVMEPLPPNIFLVLQLLTL